ncbi:pentatricopeptide repeat-containing protein [Dorcoceras hygrometricum]|uniref:Pentatricopeptide repeat-containing protein n=1 Tax=Dorcoceras hygrometricum TaxID=472368 RepID=A0A2Z7AGB9_9LAMI|nr:pentatricopeptide repeat-containing protein [Dorcoceras hygrometricum]
MSCVVRTNQYTLPELLSRVRHHACWPRMVAGRGQQARPLSCAVAAHIARPMGAVAHAGRTLATLLSHERRPPLRRSSGDVVTADFF